MLGALIVLAVVVVLLVALANSARAPRGTPSDAEPEAPPEGPAQIPIEASIDLHFFAPRDVPSLVDEYLSAARRAGFEEVRVIHGRGKGVQRARIQKQLAKHPLVLSYRSDGLGSTLVVLSPRRPAR